MDSITTLISNYMSYINAIDSTTFVISLILVACAISLLKKGLGRLSKVVFGVGFYLFSRGIITTGMLLAWWDQIPTIVSTIFLIPQ